MPQQRSSSQSLNDNEELTISLEAESLLESYPKRSQDEFVSSPRGKDNAGTVSVSDIGGNAVAQASGGESEGKLCNCVCINRELVADFEGMKLDFAILQTLSAGKDPASVNRLEPAIESLQRKHK